MRWLLLLLAPGCAWVSADDLAGKLATVDDDADGVPADEDCDDARADVYPGATDPPYDGVDGDCAGDDDYDADGDGYVNDTWVGLATHGVDGSGALPGGDCDDTDRAVHPGAIDSWYTGADTDCGGEDDYDADGDGFVPDAYVGLSTAGVPGSGGLPGGDCDDDDAAVSPFGTETIYDGVDSNCDGEDDYDQDGDGYVADEHVGLPTAGVDGSGELPGGDCDDSDAGVHPGAEDLWYDGLDADCAGNDDDDQDGDGFASAADAGGDDCDDTSADVYPGQGEILGDGVDGDCDGEPDGFPVADDLGCTWATPRAPVLFDVEGVPWLSVVDTEVRCDSRYYDAALALSLDPTDLGAGPLAVAPWLGSTADPASYSVGAGQAVVPVGSVLYGVAPLDLASGRALAMVRYDLSTGASERLTVQDAAHSTPYADVALDIGSDRAMRAFGCEAVEGAGTYVAVADLGAGAADQTATLDGLYADACVIGAQSGRERVYSNASGTLTRHDYGDTADGLAFTEVATSLVAAPRDLDWEGGADLVLADATRRVGLSYDVDAGGITSLDSGIDPVRVAVARTSGWRFYAAAASDGSAWIGYGPDGGAMTVAPLGVDFAAVDVAVWADAATVVVAVQGADRLVVGTVAAP